MSSFGSLGQRAEDNRLDTSERTRHVFVTATVDGRRHQYPGILIDWAHEQPGWLARVAYVADDDGTLIITWLPAEQLIPLRAAAAPAQPDG